LNLFGRNSRLLVVGIEDLVDEGMDIPFLAGIRVDLLENLAGVGRVDLSF